MKRSLRLVAVQMRMATEDYRTVEVFRERILGIMRTVRQQVPAEPILVVFPEDVGLGLVFTQDYERVRTSKTMVEAGFRLIEKYRLAPSGSEPPSFAAMVRRLLILLSPFVEQTYHQTFSDAAKQFQAWVVAGSAPIAHSDCVYNTCYVYDPSGERMIIQRKINLVPLEQEPGLNLCPAPCELPTVETPAGRLGVLICLDGFQHELLAQLVKQGAKLVAMPSFNPLPWTPEQAQGWEAGLWEGVQKHREVIGINPMGVGQLFDVIAEGRSSIVAHKSQTPDKSGYLRRAKTKDHEEILIW